AELPPRAGRRLVFLGPPPRRVRPHACRDRVTEGMTQGTSEPKPVDTKIDNAAKIRHDVRTPVSQILDYSELLLEDAEERGQESLACDLKKIHAAATKLLKLLDQYFPSSKGAAAQTTPAADGGAPAAAPAPTGAGPLLFKEEGAPPAPVVPPASG